MRADLLLVFFAEQTQRFPKSSTFGNLSVCSRGEASRREAM